MTTPHKHAVILRAIADGKVVQYQTQTGGCWTDFQPDIHVFPTNDPDLAWRVKPEEVVDFAPIHHNGIPGAQFFKSIINLKTYFEHPEKFQGYLKRTRIDGKVVSFEFISQ